METFADYILKERDIATKMDITYYLAKKARIHYDKSVIFKTEIARLFIECMEIQVDKNEVVTASLLCNCKKLNNIQDIEKVHSYAKEGAEYLYNVGFSKKFCKICEEVNRYSGSNPRERESDILELVDQFGGMLLDRPERIGFKPEEALILLEHRNLKDVYNRYLHTFAEFVQIMEHLEIEDTTKITALRFLTKIYNETKDIKQFIKKVCYEYQPKVTEAINKYRLEIKYDMLGDSKRPLFSKETTKKILAHIAEENQVEY